jgi:hypothetical protein
LHSLHNEFTAIIERDGKWYIGYCPEIPGANGQGEAIDECKKTSLMRLPLSFRTGGKMPSAVCLRTPFRT